MCRSVTVTGEDMRACFSAYLRHCHLVCLYSWLCSGMFYRRTVLPIIHSAHVLCHYTTNYGPGMHITAFLVACVNTKTEWKDLFVYSCSCFSRPEEEEEC